MHRATLTKNSCISPNLPHYSATMAKKHHDQELDQLKKYLKSDENEDAKRPFLFPLFQKLFGDKFRSESAANGADVYIEGKMLVESKTSKDQWVDGFYQALHYQKRFGMAYNTIMVIAHEFVAIWKLNKLPEAAVIFSHTAKAQDAPNAVGKANAKRTQPALRQEIKKAAFYWLEPADLKGGFFEGARSLTVEVHEILKILNNLESDRLQITSHSFIRDIAQLRPFFETPIEAVHAFYTMAAYWDITSTLVQDGSREDSVRVIGFKGSKLSDPIQIRPRQFPELKKFVESHYIFTNEGSGLTVDYYFSRFDEVLAEIDPEYVKQHGIFFTDINLSKFALWFVRKFFTSKLDEDYIVFDPAGGSGNLVSSWRGQLRHKIVSELQPDLLKTIERRMKLDPWHTEHGFTIIPKTHDNVGLNFLDRSGADYFATLVREMEQKNIVLDKPLAFLLNPPYKNTDENQESRAAKDADYQIHPSILELTGEDAGKERYLAFLGQILNIAKEQVSKYPDLKPIVLIFTPTSWLLPRPTYVPFRQHWDQHFKYESGFIVNASSFFDVKGKWPLAFTIWSYAQSENENSIRVTDLTSLQRSDLGMNWEDDSQAIDTALDVLLKSKDSILLDNSRLDIRSLLPEISRQGKLIRQPRFDFSRAKNPSQSGHLVSGFPLLDKKNHYELNRQCGSPAGSFLGTMDDLTPVRLDQDSCARMSSAPDRIWFQLRPTFLDVNLTKALSSPPDKYGYCCYDLSSAAATCTWFAITKAVNARYPIWANQFDIWAPRTLPELDPYLHSLCFAFTLAENRCVVTRFEKDNPVKGAPEVYVENPLCPTNPNAFWATTLDKHIVSDPPLAKELVDSIKALYRLWSHKHCKNETLKHVGLQDEPYFKFFSYPDFLTSTSGLVQIRKYAEIHGKADLLEAFADIAQRTKAVKEEIYRLLVEDYKYFE
jgi:hypothetical protein